MLRQLVALVTVTAVAIVGCGGRAWPSAAATVADPTFTSRHHAIVTVDVLPLDLAVWTEAGVSVNPGELRARAETRIMNAALEALTRRAYGIDSLIDWNGQAAGNAVIERADLLATVAALARYGAAVELQPGTLPGAALPAKLGQATGSDATLYIGGWAYVAAHRESTGSKVAKGIAIALVTLAVIGIVVAIAAAASKDSSSSSSNKKSADHKPRSGGAAVRDHREDEIVEVRDHRSSTAPVIRDHRSGTWAGAPIVRDHRAGETQTTPRARRGERDVAVDLSWMTDAVADIALESTWRAQQPAQDLGKDSQLYLEMTLVDNRTGLVLWHAHQAFPANATKPGDTERAARLLLSTLPAR